MNDDTIKILKIKGYTMLMQDIQKLIYKYDKLVDEEISGTTHATAHETLTIFKNELINNIESIVNQ